MASHLKALPVVLFLALFVFAFAKISTVPLGASAADVMRRRTLWIAITLTAFLAHSYWIFVCVSAAMLLFVAPRDTNRLALYFFILFAVPPISAQIGGLGIIRHFFEMNYLRLLSLAVLLPAFLALRTKDSTDRFGTLIPDKILLAYLALNFFLMLSASTFTNTLRFGAFYPFIDVFLPYYVASRSLRSIEGFRDALSSFVAASLVLSAIALFEFGRHWLLYANVDDALGAPWAYTGYLTRGKDGALRAVATAGHAIALGYVIAIALGFMLFLRSSSAPGSWRLGVLLLLGGIIAPVSRGPWVGAAAIFVVFLATSPGAAVRFIKTGVLGGLVMAPILASPLGEDILKYIPFVGGGVEESTIDYRQRLLAISLDVISENPLLGGYNFMYSPAFQELKQGNTGFIDFVNTYVGVGLSSGLIGLTLFAGFFLKIMADIFLAMRRIADRTDERYLLAQALFATLSGILVIIGTASSITVIPFVYWAVAGLGVSYARMQAHAGVQSATSLPVRKPGFGAVRA